MDRVLVVSECHRGTELIRDTVLKIVAPFSSQMIAMATDKELKEIPDDIAKLTYDQTMSNHQLYADRHFAAVRRKLLAIDPTFLSS